MIILRPATPADIPALAALGRDSFVAKFGHLYRAADLAEFLEATFSPSAIERQLADPGLIYHLAEADGALAGYAKIALATAFPDHARSQSCMELKQLYTDPALTGRGLGAMLMDWAMAQFSERGAGEVHLSVYSDNAGAQRFYHRYGFEKLADIFFMVGSHRDDEFLFARVL
jgi:ribosomal protein S18 acetylase RimI-like enzyme